jgi:hypothetical protein
MDYGDGCFVVNSGTLNQWEINAYWKVIGQNEPGYNRECDCYCPGYKPAPTPEPVIDGLGLPPAGSAYTYPHKTRDLFRVCSLAPNTKSAAGCRACAAQPQADTPQLAPPTFAQQGTTAGVWGTNLGWMLAGAVVAGGGYYAYKKGVFKKSYWKKRR